MIVRKGRSTIQIERTQSAVSYAILITFLLFVIFPFYWMIVTSFKGENQMRSLVSMFWPSPFVAENYEHLFKKTEFVSTITSRIKTLRDLAAEAQGRPPTESEVKKMRDLANSIEAVALGPVDSDGKILSSSAQ